MHVFIYMYAWLHMYKRIIKKFKTVWGRIHKNLCKNAKVYNVFWRLSPLQWGSKGFFIIIFGSIWEIFTDLFTNKN